MASPRASGTREKLWRFIRCDSTPTHRPIVTLLCWASVLGWVPSILAQEHGRTPEANLTDAWSGFVAIGPYNFPQYSGGRARHTQILPLVAMQFGERAYFEFREAGVFLYANDAKDFGIDLIVVPRFGYSASDGPKLNGMARRRTGLEMGLGAALSWRDIELSAAYLGDILGTPSGTVQRLMARREFEVTGAFSLMLGVAWERLSARTANYYYGVNADEVRPDRRRYQPNSGRLTSTSMQGSYNLSKNYVLVFGAEFERLGAAVSNSPIVEQRWSQSYYVGAGWRF